MADFTINSLATGALNNVDNFVKSNDAGVLNKVDFETLKESVIGDELHTYTYDRVNISTDNFSGYIDFYGCGRVISFRARLAALTTITKNTELTLATLTGNNFTRYAATLRQYKYGFAAEGATFKGCIEFSINNDAVVLRSPDVALAVNDVIYVSGEYIKH